MKVVGILGVVALLLGVGSTAAGFLFLRSSLRQFEAADCSLDDLAARYGEIASYRPEPDGTIRADRVEAFLTAREQVRPRREKVEHALTLVSGDDAGGVLAKLRGTVGLLRNLGTFHRERNEALIDSGVGLGEYYYLYTLTYYAWLDKAPADGPTFKVVGEKGYLLETIEDLEEAEVRSYRTEHARTSLNRLLLPVLRNQLAALSARRTPHAAADWQAALATEIAALEADARRLPWEDGLPSAVERSLRPYRDRLSQSYSPLCNAIEVGLARRTPDPAAGAAQSDGPGA